MKVFAYFEQIPGIQPDLQLLDCWRRTWEHYGWQPEELTRAQATLRSPGAASRILASAELGRGPCPEGYNYATHLRWAAFASIGGLIVDYDVMNNGFTPDDLNRLRERHERERPIFLNACPCCCAVYAEPAAASRMLARILQHEEEARDAASKGAALEFRGELSFVCHDQAIFERFKDDWQYPEQSYVTEFGVGDWRNAPLIHFCNSRTKSPRGRVVRMSGIRGLR